MSHGVNLPKNLRELGVPPGYRQIDICLLTYDKHERLKQLVRQFPDVAADHLKGLEENAVPRLLADEYNALHSHLSRYRENSPDLNKKAYAAYLLFGTVDKLEQFTKRCRELNQTDSNAATILACIEFPDPKHWGKIDFRAWGHAFIQRGNIETNPYFLKLAKDSVPLRNSKGAISLRRTDFTVMAESYKKVHNNPDIDKLLELALSFNKKANEFGRALKAFTAEKDDFCLPDTIGMPPLVIDGRKFGMYGYTFRKMERDDPRLLFVGDQTRCCERITDDKNPLERTVVQACRTNSNAYYIVEDEIGTIVAHSWAWRGKSGEFVLDGFESKEEYFGPRELNLLLPAIVNETQTTAFDSYEMLGVFVGRCAEHLEVKRPLQMVAHEKIMPDSIKNVGMGQTMLMMVGQSHDLSLKY